MQAKQGAEEQLWVFVMLPAKFPNKANYMQDKQHRVSYTALENK
jgi:hypothetical protein